MSTVTGESTDRRLLTLGRGKGYRDRMAWTKPAHTRDEVVAAGIVLRDKSADRVTRMKAIAIADNWRSSHRFPLNTFQMALRVKARKITSQALVAQRLKRMPAIQSKLRRFERLSLDKLQDIGGCRAIVPAPRQVYALVNEYKASTRSRSRFEYAKDYIADPKPDGYRSYHLIYSFASTNPTTIAYNGHRVEIQLRTRLQHAWAAAVETVDLFTGQALKSSIGRDDWKRFFVLMSGYIAIAEQCPPVAAAPSRRSELLDELKPLAFKLNVRSNFEVWSKVAHTAQEKIKKAKSYLLIVDPRNKTVSVTGFAESRAADVEYTAAESRITAEPWIQAVLVRAESLAATKRAYPSYFLDTRLFMHALDGALKSK